MDNSINLTRQESLNLSIPSSVAVVGCGGVGSWTAYFLALAGVPEIYLFDNDVISGHNLNRVPVPEAEIGTLKSTAVKHLIHTVRPRCTVLAMGAFSKNSDALHLQETLEWIIATTDTLSSRRFVKAWADEWNIKYIEAAAEGEMGSATGETAEWSTPAEDNPGYASVPVWMGPCVTSAIIAVFHVIHNTRMGDRTVRLGWGKGFEIFDSEKV